jgi:hypothetical protein
MSPREETRDATPLPGQTKAKLSGRVWWASASHAFQDQRLMTRLRGAWQAALRAADLGSGVYLRFVVALWRGVSPGF